MSRAGRRGTVRLVAASVVLAAIVGATAHVVWTRFGPAGSDPDGAGRQPVGNGLFAMTDGESLTLMRGSSPATTMPAGDGWSLGRPRFTADAAYAYAISSSDDRERHRILVVDVATGGQHTVDCPDCPNEGTPVAAGGSSVAYLDQRNQQADLRILDLATPEEPPSTTPVRGLPPTPDPDHGYRVIAAVPDVVLVAPSRGTGNLQLISRDGTARTVAGDSDSVPFDAAAGTVDGATVFAFDAPVIRPVEEGEFHSCQSAGVSLLDPASGQLTRTSGFAIEHGPDDGTRVTDLWWGADGELYALVRPFFCRTDRLDRGNPDHRRARPVTLWRLTDGQWERLDSLRGAEWIRQIDPETQIILDRGRRLVVQDAQRQVPVATDREPMVTVPPATGADPAMAVRTTPPPCTEQLFADRAPTLIDEPDVTSVNCQDGYAHVQFTDTAHADQPRQAVLFAAIGASWHTRALSTGWDGRFRPADLVYFGLDPQELQPLFPDLMQEPPPSAEPPDVSAFVGAWRSQEDGLLEVRPDGSAEATYLVDRWSDPVRMSTVQLKIILATRNSAIAEVVGDDGQGAEVGSQFRFGFQGDWLVLTPPYGYGNLFKPA